MLGFLKWPREEAWPGPNPGSSSLGVSGGQAAARRQPHAPWLSQRLCASEGRDPGSGLGAAVEALCPLHQSDKGLSCPPLPARRQRSSPRCHGYERS